MIRYRNLGGDSGVHSFELGEDRIIVRFSDGATYEYTNASAGAHNVHQMKMLASRGVGLNSFINRNVKRRYSRKITRTYF